MFLDNNCLQNIWKYIDLSGNVTGWRVGMSCGCKYRQELEVRSLHYMYMPHNQKLKCHIYVMTL